MGKTDPLLPCPHCGKEMRAGSLKRHESLCIRNPAAFARYREVLAATPGGKQGITCKRYAELSGTDKTLPIALTLHRQAGTSTWDALLAVFSLEPPPAEERRTVCGHCGKFVAATDLAEHTQACARRRRQCAAVPRPRPVRRGACARARAVPARRAATHAADGRRVFARAPGADRDAGGERGCCEVGGLQMGCGCGMMGLSDQDTDSGFFVCLNSYPACRQSVGLHPASVKPLVCLWSDTDANRPIVVPQEGKHGH